MRDSNDNICPTGSQSDCSGKLLQAVTPRSLAKQDSRTPEEWTLAVDLTLNMSRTTGSDHIGAEQKSTWLKSLAEQSKGKPVAMVVQVHRATDEHAHNKQNEIQPKAEYERYVIEDGAVREMKAPQGKDPAKNLSDLVFRAGYDYPAKHYGLVVFSHGFASEGIQTDNGAVPMPKFAASVQSALDKLGHPKLDLVGYDACLMGETNVLAQSQDFSKRVVASPELVPCQGEKACGFDLSHWFGALLDDPNMTGKEFGQAAVDTENKYAGRGEKNPGPSIVGSYDLGNSFDSFERALNTFGSDMANSIKADKGNREQLKKIVGQTERYDRYFWNAMDIEPKDLVDFAKRVKAGVEHGDIKDPSGKIIQDSDNLVRSYSNVLSGSYFAPYYDAMQTDPTPAYLEKRSAQKMQSYDKLGGLSIFLPDEGNYPKLRSNPKILKDQISPKLPGWKCFIDTLVF